MVIIYLTLAWSAGILIASGSPASSQLALWIITGAAISGAVLLRHDRRQRLIFACIAAASLGMLRMSAASAPPSPDALAHYNDQGWFAVEGVIIDEPDIRDTQVNLRVRVDALRHYEDSTDVAGVALIQAPRYGDYAYGDRITASGTLLTPAEFDDFSYRDYLARQGIYTLIPNAAVTITAHDQGNPLFAALLTLKQRARLLIANTLPEPQASLLTGILLGVETGISPEVRDAFNATGASHVIAISGFNMTLIAGLLSRMLGVIWPQRRRLTAILSIGAVAVYTLFVGAAPAVVRAAIMSSLLVIAPLFNRRTYVPASLAFAALLMSLDSPFVLWDVGFQLSFAAVLGLALFVHPVEGIFRRMLAPLFSSDTVEKLLQLLSEPLIVTLAAQITTLPLIAYYFGRFSLSSFAVNFLILPVQTPLLLLGGLAVIIGLIVPLAGQPFFWGSWLFLSWTVEVVRFFARMPGGNLALDISGGGVAVFYLAIIAGAIVQGTSPGWKRRIGQLLTSRGASLALMGAGAITAAVLWLAVLAQPDGLLHVTFLETGHSNGVLIVTPEGSQILVDGGKYPTRLLTALGDHLPFWDRDLDLLILTQPKNTQIAGIPAVLDRYTVHQVFTNGQHADADNYLALLDRLTEQAIPTQAIFAGYTIQTDDGLQIEVLHPQAIPAADSKPNDEGMVLRVTYGEASFLLTPDMSEQAEAVLVNSGQWLHGTVIQLPSHGSNVVSSAALLDAAGAQLAVVQVDTGNRYGHPAEDVIERLQDTPLYRTDHHGEVSISTDGQTLWITTARMQ
jgi:competence protein ComEC